MKWEYRVVDIVSMPNGSIRVEGRGGEKALTPVLCTEGAAGWELVQLWALQGMDKTAVIFKRPQGGSA